MAQAGPPTWLRRARPMIGTLVEVGLPARRAGDTGRRGVEAAFAAIEHAQQRLSRFDPDSDVSRFHALRCGDSLAVHAVTRQVLAAALELQAASHGLFDISLGTAPEGWALDGHRLCKLSDAVRLDLAGLGKGHAVDLAVRALRRAGAAAGWVNAGGDLRVFGDIDLPVHLRAEPLGGGRPFALLHDGAFATSAFGPGHRARLAGAGHPAAAAQYVSVAAPRCLWADALTKIVAASGDAAHPLLARYGASAWLH